MKKFNPMSMLVGPAADNFFANEPPLTSSNSRPGFDDVVVSANVRKSARGDQMMLALSAIGSTQTFRFKMEIAKLLLVMLSYRILRRGWLDQNGNIAASTQSATVKH